LAFSGVRGVQPNNGLQLTANSGFQLKRGSLLAAGFSAGALAVSAVRFS